jgi:predicted ribosomally synthesized peptide with SipW-like signal peptide
VRNKIALVAGCTALLGLALVGAGGTYAAFSDTEAAEPVLVRAGTLDLVLTDGEGLATAPVTFADVVPAPAVTSGRHEPSPHHYFVRLTNDGSVPGAAQWSTTAVSELDRGCNRAETDAGDTTCGAGPLEGELGEQLLVSFSLLAGPDCTGDPVGTRPPYVPAVGRDAGPIVTGDGSALVLGPDETRCVRVDVHFPEGPDDNLAQSDSSTFRLSFRLDQA